MKQRRPKGKVVFTMIRNGKKPFPKPAFDFTISHQGGSYQYKSAYREGYNLQTERR